MSSADDPPPPADLGNKLSIVSHYRIESLIAAVIYALSCIPNTSGLSFIGSSLIKSLYESKVPSGGQ